MRQLIGFSTLAALVLSLSAPSAQAGDKGAKKDPAEVFRKRDKDKDGGLTLAEMTGKGKKDAATIEKKFKSLDKNKDGKVTLAEMTATKKKKKGA